MVKRHTIEARFNMRGSRNVGTNNPMFGHRHTPEARLIMASAKKGTVWIKQGMKSKRIRLDELESYVLSGWELGRAKFHRRVL